ncbi:MAG: hypothetical protein JEY96_00840 [Bacteroidales bacterium]|nr:hypothetical protein [Bacteroidales bacterium]
MTFVTNQQYENYNYRFFREDDGSFVVRIYLEDRLKQVRTHKNNDELLEKYGKHFPELIKLL